MTTRDMLRLMMLVAVTALPLTAFGAQQELPPRPQISDYADQSQFVSDVLAWERLRAQRSEQPAETPEEATTPSDWHHVTGPEDLDTALHNAQGYVQPNYREPIRYNRTTHISFPLKRLDSVELSSKAASSASVSPERQQQSSGFSRLPEQVIEQLEQLEIFSAQERTARLLSGTIPR